MPNPANQRIIQLNDNSPQQSGFSICDDTGGSYIIRGERNEFVAIPIHPNCWSGPYTQHASRGGHFQSYEDKPYDILFGDQTQLTIERNHTPYNLNKPYPWRFRGSENTVYLWVDEKPEALKRKTQPPTTELPPPPSPQPNNPPPTQPTPRRDAPLVPGFPHTPSVPKTSNINSLWNFLPSLPL